MSSGPKTGISPRPQPVPTTTAVPFSFVHINKCGGSSVEIALGLPKRHATASVLRDELGAEEWRRRFTFSIVRNPFDRIVSLYFYRVRLNYQRLGDRHISLNRWVAAIWLDGDERYIDRSFLNNPCTDWLTGDDGAILVERVLRLEDISTGWGEITTRLGVDIALPVRNVNLRPAYRDVINAESRSIIEAAFAEDFSRFSYDY